MIDLTEILRRFRARGGVSAQTADELAAELYNAETEPDGWLIRYTREDGERITHLCRHNAIADYRAIDPAATSEPVHIVKWRESHG